jgi:SOUL heme-binding protein
MTESPAYTVESKDGDVEIRVYPGYILAQVDVKADFDSAIGMGFRILANYIFGGNKKKSRISMTAPVSGENLSESERIPMTIPVTEEDVEGSENIPMAAPVTEENAGKHTYRISFTMPSKYTLDTLPEPDDGSIKFREVRNQKMSVLKFKGRVNHKLADQEVKELKNWLEKNNIQPKSNYIIAQYNNPAVPGFLRRNEVMVEI